MKNITLILALVFVGVSASANPSKAVFSSSNYGEAFIFVEGGVEFAVYPNGEFDFHYNPQFINTSIIHVPNPGSNISYNAGYNYDAFVQYDDYGAVIQVEHVPVYYDHYGRILQAGDVIIRYNNKGLITRVGNMQVRYNKFNHPVRYIGVINHYNTRYVHRPWHQYYMRPHANYRVVYFEPYRAYYEPMRMNYVQYNTYYQSNNYYYNKSNFYRPGQPAVAYNHGRRTSTVREQNNVIRNSSAVSGNASRSIATDNARSTNSVTRAAANSTGVTRQRSNMEQHEAALRAQRNTENTSAPREAAVSTTRNMSPTPVSTRSSVTTGRTTNAAPVTQARTTVQRPAPATTRSAVPQQQSSATRSTVSPKAQTAQRSTTNTVRAQSTPQRTQEVIRSSGASSGRSGGRG